MTFTLALTDEQVALRDRTRELARTVIRPAASEYDRAQALRAQASELPLDQRMDTASSSA